MAAEWCNWFHAVATLVFYRKRFEDPTDPGESMSRIQYAGELESVRLNLTLMGATTVALLGEALHSLVTQGDSPLEKASELEAQTDHQHRLIHDQCLRLITLQAPVARDARLVTGALDAIVDLELIGDYAYEIVTLSNSAEHRPPHPIMRQISAIGSGAREILSLAIDGWRSEEAAQGLSMGPQSASIRGECQTLYGKLSQLASAPGDAMPYVNLMLICRHLERISRHAACVAEQAAGAVPASIHG